MGVQNRNGITKSQLRELIGDVVGNKVDEALKPHLKQSTNWFSQIQASANQNTTPSKIKDSPGIDCAKFIRAVAVANGDQERAYSFAKGMYGVDDRCTKSLLAGDFTGGGVLVKEELASEIIELLRAKSVVRQLGPRIVRPKSGSMDFPRLSVSATSSYVEEGGAITVSNPQFDSIRLSPKKLASIVNVSNELLTYGQDTETIIRDDLVASIATLEDIQLVRGDGLNASPLGIRQWTAAANVIAANASVSLANVTSDLFQLLNALEGSDAPMPYAWVMSPRSKNYLMSVRTTDGTLAFPSMHASPMSLLTWPVFTTNNLPNDLGSGSDSEVYLLSPTEILLGEMPGLMIDVSREGSYTEGGSLRSAFERDTTLVRVTMKHDIAMRHPQSIAYLTGVTWQAA